MRIQNKEQPEHIKQFYSEPAVKILLCSCKNFIKFVREHIDEPNGLALIRKQLHPIIIPVELKLSIADLWQTTVDDLKRTHEKT